MSGSMNPVPSIDELRRRFAIWSLAIFGSLSGSGNVRLESNAWGADDPPTEAKASTEKKTEGSDDQAFDREAFQQLVQGKEFALAAKMIDEALAKEASGTNLYFNYLLASGMLNAKDPAGLARMESVASQSAQALDDNASPQLNIAFAMSHQSLATRLAADKQADKAIDLIKAALAKLDGPSVQASSAQLTATLTSLLLREGLVDEAKSLSSQRLERALNALKENPSIIARNTAAIAFSQFNTMFGSKFPEDAQSAYDTIEPLLRQAVEADSAKVADYMAYQTVQTALALSKADTDASAAMKTLDATREVADALAKRIDASEQALLKSAQSTLRTTESRIKSKLLHQSLIGQAAPEFDIEAVVNMPKVSWSDLKGKVVLIDFWAVWCGPCIATFPHLQEWKKTYGDKGLVIVGVTRQYGYKWDKEQNKHVSEKDASLETELEMLEEFRKAHELEHGFVVMPKGSDYNSKFGVTGIPQAVLVDQNGVIQLIKVGSGEKNAEELEAKIKSLLGV